MGEVVDSIIAELILKNEQYVRGYDQAIAKHGEFMRSIPKFGSMQGISSSDAQKYVDRHTKAAGDVAKGEEQTTERVKRTRKARADANVVSDEKEVSSAKAAGAARVASEEATQARISAAVQRGLDKRAAATRRGSGRDLSTSNEPGLASAQTAIMGRTVVPGAVGDGAAAEETAVNHLLVDQFELRSRIKNATGAEKRELQDQLEYLRRIAAYEAAGLSTKQAQVRAEAELEVIEGQRTKNAAKQALAGTGKFAEGAGLLRTGGGAAAIAGITTAIGVGIATEAIASAVAYGKALKTLSDQLGITVEDLQAYEKLAHDAGASTEQLTSSFGQFSSNLGRAQQGSEEQAKAFKALGVNIKEFASAGDALPTVIDRISSIKDPAQRAAIETRLFGEEGRRLDAVLSGGASRVGDLAKALQVTGAALSAREIRDLDNTARKLAEVKNALSVDLARVVAGNSTAIIGLAQSFATLTNAIGGTISRLQVFYAKRVLASNVASADDKAVQREFLLSTPTGRQALKDQNTAAIQALGGGSRLRVRVNGQDVSSDPALLAAENAKVQSKRQGLLRQRKEILDRDRAEANAIATPSVQPGAVDPKLLGSLGAPKGPRGKSADQLAKEADQRQRRYEDQLAQSTAEYLSAQRQLTGGVEERYAIDQSMLKTDYERRDQDIVREANEKQIDASKVKELQAANDKVYQEKLAVLALEKAVALENQANDLRQNAYGIEITALQSAQALADTAAERRRIGERILAKEREAETANLNSIINSKDPGVSKGERDKAQQQLDSQGQRYGDLSKQNARDNAGPLATYLRSLPKSVDQLNEALEQAAAGGLQQLNDGLGEAIKGFLGLHGAAGQFIADLIRIQLEHEALSLFGGNSGGSGLFGSIFSALGIGGKSSGSGAATNAVAGNFSLSALGFAGGGSMVIGGNPGVDRNQLSLNGNPIARVGQGEVLAVLPNVAAANQRVMPASSGNTIKNYQVTVNADNTVAPEGFARGLAAQILAEADKMDAQRQGQTLSTTPEYLQRRQVLGS